MTTSQRELKILDTLPVTYWVEGNTRFKKTTDLEWENKRIIAQELATIVPVAINNIRDAAVDVWPTIRRTVVENMHKKIDDAIIMGKDKPPMFRASLVDTIINAGANIQTTTNFYSDTDLAMAKVEACGYTPNAIMGLLSAWLAKVPIQGKDGVFKLKKYPELENNMSIIEIEITSFPHLIDRLSPNIELHEARLRLKYFVRKSFFRLRFF